VDEYSIMTAAECATVLDTGLDTDTWLAHLLENYTIAPPSVETDSAGIQARLSTVSLVKLIAAIERPDRQPGEQATIYLYRQWIAGQREKSNELHAAWFNLGVSLSRADDTTNAIIAYQNALLLRPDFYPAAANLGTLLESIGQTDAALRIWQQALQPNEVRLILINNRARLLEQVGRLDEAERELRCSLTIDPAQPDVVQHWVHIRQKMCAWPIIETDIAGLTPESLMRHAGAMTTLALTDDIEAQLRAGQDWIARKTAPVPFALCPPWGYCHDRIRVGYLSSDFCSHAMSYLIAELFERHDRSRFEVYGYCSSPEDGSAIRARVMRSFDRFERIRNLSDEEAARLIRRDEIDILIDLNGLTSGVRPQILRARPAPVQATYLGFVGPVPLPELDHMFCDRMVVPPHLASAYRPAPLYIEGNYQANDGKRTIGPAMTRAEADLPDDKFVFCCFSNHYKTTEDIFAAWMEILRRSDNAILWLVSDNEWARANMLKRAAELGIDPGRIVFAPRVGPDEYMARLRLADLFLDTFPYNAGTIASDAIRMGLPLVTLCGQAFASRMAASLLTTIGATRGIATSLQLYIDLAVSLAADERAYSAYKSIFNPDNWRRTIGNIEYFTEAYEDLLVSIAKPGTLAPGVSVSGRPKHSADATAEH
jgi:predicted O-linked N-acetylglucosamine transferase (SPINDLY family)